MKAPNGCALKAVKAPKGKILCYKLTQGDKVWRDRTAAQAIEAREADIQRATEESDLPIMLVNPTDDPTEIALCGFRVLGSWRYGFVRKPTAHGLGLDCFGGSGERKFDYLALHQIVGNISFLAFPSHDRVLFRAVR